jgi:hypothetical protein
VILETENWTPEMLAEYKRRRKGRNYLLLAVLGGFCLVIYAIACVKLHEYGQMWYAASKTLTKTKISKGGAE